MFDVCVSIFVFLEIEMSVLCHFKVFEEFCPYYGGIVYFDLRSSGTWFNKK